ncbi:hypothetical protein [Cohnella terricola]|nr:hypothetical protein [Cohnella terricola]
MAKNKKQKPGNANAYQEEFATETNAGNGAAGKSTHGKSTPSKR